MIFNLRLKNIFFILVGSAIFSFGIVNINIVNNLAEGGFTGLTLILYALFGLKPSITNLVLNVPLFLVGYKLLGRTTFLYSIVGTISVSLFLGIFEQFPFPLSLQDDLTLAALFAGLFIGVGLGIIFRFGGTTGGVDIIARLVHKYNGWSMGKTMFMFDAVVILLSLTYLDYKEAMYTLVAVFVGARVIDFMQEGAYAARGAIIISQYSKEISIGISKELERGATLLKGIGTYTNEPRDVLYCVVSKNEVVRLKNVIDSIDPHAFVSVTEVHDVLGEGFTLDENKNPIER